MTDDRPEIALITNHGYAGVNLPVGGAPDTGGQNLYVNSLALALENLGHRVTIFARGGFPHFGEKRVRGGSENLSRHVRYVFVPGGGDEFLLKEEIAIALDEQSEWLAEFVAREAAEKGCDPWDHYEVVNTHYWDAAVLGGRLVERWQEAIATRAMAQLLDGVVSREEVVAPAGSVDVQLGRRLLAAHGSQSDPLPERFSAAAMTWARARGVGEDRLRQAVVPVDDGSAPALRNLAAAEALGRWVLDSAPDVRSSLEADLLRADKHVWTPHSLGELKDVNFRGKPVEVRRELRFCERRSHERMVCARTRAFAATSSEIAEWLHTHYDVPVERIFYFPPCVDARRFRAYGTDEIGATYRYLAEASGVDAERLRGSKIVFETSRMDSTKRKDLLLEAFGRAVRGRDDTYLFIGGGPQNDLFRALELQRDADALLRERAFLLGFIPDEHMGPLFSLADVYASPSEMEGFGMSVAQAAASGAAILTNELTPFAVQYAPDDAVIVPAGRVDEYAQGLEQLLADDVDRERRARGLAAAALELDWNTQAEAFLDHLRRRGMEIGQGRPAG